MNNIPVIDYYLEVDVDDIYSVYLPDINWDSYYD